MFQSKISKNQHQFQLQELPRIAFKVRLHSVVLFRSGLKDPCLFLFVGFRQGTPESCAYKVSILAAQNLPI